MALESLWLWVFILQSASVAGPAWVVSLGEVRTESTEHRNVGAWGRDLGYGLPWEEMGA